MRRVHETHYARLGPLCVGIAVAATRCELLRLFSDLSFTNGNPGNGGRVFSTPVLAACQDTNPVLHLTVRLLKGN
jgi:hypothetical protein